MTLPFLSLLLFACASGPTSTLPATVSPPKWIYPDVVSAGDVLEIRFYNRNRLDSDSYRAETGDVLRVDVVDHPEATSEGASVLPDGTISLALVGSLGAAGKTCAQISAEAAQLYVAARIKDPKVVVSVAKGQQRLTGFLQTLASDPGGSRFVLKVYDESGLDLPLIPRVRVERPLSEIRDEIKAAYAAEFGDQIEVTVNLTDRTTPCVYVLGEVRSPGAVELIPGTGLLDVVARAGGLAETADTEEVLVMRRHDDGTYDHWKLNLHEMISNEKAAAFQPARNDVIYVSRSGIASADLFVQQYIRGLLPFNLGLGIAVPTR